MREKSFRARETDLLLPSVVGIHDLEGHAIEIWRKSKDKKLWLRDYLPLHISSAPIMTFGFRANVAFSRSTTDIESHASDLSSTLFDNSETDEVSTYLGTLYICTFLRADRRQKIGL